MTERRRIGPLLRWSLSLAALGSLALWLDVSLLLDELADLSTGWLVAALSITVLQTLISAWRWRFTSARLGLPLSWSRAVGDYYLAQFVNQVVPGGVAGDALRAHRHARLSEAAGPAWRAVVIERASGQVVVALATLSVLALVPAWREMLAIAWDRGANAWIWPLLAVMTVVALAVAVARRWSRHWDFLRGEVHVALLSSSAWPRQLAASSAIVLSYALVFALVGRGIGVELSFGLLMAVALPLLLAMLIPFSVAGWGFREAAAAAVWLALGLPVEQGVAVAVTYGAISLLAALPGAVVLLRGSLQS